MPRPPRRTAERHTAAGQRRERETFGERANRACEREVSNEEILEREGGALAREHPAERLELVLAQGHALRQPARRRGCRARRPLRLERIEHPAKRTQRALAVADRPRQQADAVIQLGLRARLAGGRRAGGRRAALLLPRADERRQQALGAGVALSCAAALQSVHAQPRLDAHARGVPAKRCASSQAARAPTRRTCRGRASRQSRQTCRPLARARRGCAPPVGLYRQPASPAPPPDRRRRLGRGGH
jgi:hypothetical protein